MPAVSPRRSGAISTSMRHFVEMLKEGMVAVALAGLLVCCSDEGSDQEVSPQGWADVWEGSASDFLTVTGGAPTREESIDQCERARDRLEQAAPALTSAADEELAELAEQWVSAAGRFYDLCVEHSAGEDERVEALERANDAGGAAVARLAELGVQTGP